MKKITYLLMFLILCNIKTYSQNQSSSSQSKTDLENIMLYKRIQIDRNTPDLIKKLENVGVDLGCGVYYTENQIQIEISEYELDEISKQGITYTVLIDDVTKFYAERAVSDMANAQNKLNTDKKKSSIAKSSSIKSVAVGNIGQRDDATEIDWTTPTNFTLPSTFGGCLTYTGMAAELDKMRAKYPNLISVKANASPTNQLTYEGRPVYYVKISDNPDSNEASSESQVLYTGMTHSREVSSLMNQIYFMWYVLENYNSDPYLKNLVDHTEMFFIPVVNPDGLTYNETTAPTGGGMQRKNRRPNGGSCSGTLEGVDVNRNFGYYYGLTSSEATKCVDTYRGTAAFSEAESQIVRDFVLSKNIKTALNHHGYANIIPHPINGKATTLSGRENEFAKFSHDMSQYNRYLYGPAPGILYAASGDLSDWMCGGANDGTGSTGSGKNILSASPENGSSAEGGFWPTPSNIPIIAQRAMRMNFISAYYAGKYAKFHDLTQSDISSLSSNLTFGIERLGQTAATYTLTVTPVSSNIVSITSPAAITGMTILQQSNVTAALVLSSSIKANEKIEYKISLSNGDYVLYEANYVKIYNPTVLFNNNPDIDLLTKWTTSGGSWVNTATAFTGTNSISDSAIGTAYTNNTSKYITTTSAVSLSGAQKVLVQYYAKWDIERNYDLVQIQGSSNGGTTWVTLNGNYTKPTATTETNYHSIKTTTSDAFQNTSGGGGVVYDGDTMDKWVMEEIVIDANNNPSLVGSTNAKFRFQFKTDSSNNTSGYNTTFDGFYFDDFKVIKQISEPPVAICKNATLSLDSSGNLTVLPSDINNGSSDDIGITAISVSPNTFNCTHKNTDQTVTLTVTDADGQTSTCTSVVTIKDTTAPVPNTASLTTVNGQCSATLTAPTATDTCYGTITATTPTTFPITAQGTTVVTWTYTDGSGNTSTQTQNVVLNNTMAAVISGSASICSGSSTNIQVAITGGTSPYTVVYTDGSSSFTLTNYTSGSAISVAPTVATTYTLVSVTSAIGCLSPSNSGSATISFPTTTWNGSWNNGAPTSASTAIISSNYSASTNLTACTLTVNNNAVVSIPSGYNVTLNGALTVSSGSFTLNNNANLIQSSNVSNVGNIIIKRETSALMRQDYAMWSSPVTNTSQYLKTFSPSTLDTRFYTYTPSTNLYASVVPTTTNFATGKGYLIRMPNDHPTTPTIWTGTFTGIPYNGNLNLSVTNGTYNAIGNPYPSTISANTFISTNGITEALYFWRKTNNNTYSSYATYTTAGGTANVGGGSSIIPNGIIQVGQGFIAKATSTNLQFTNAMRVGNNLNQFLRTKEIELNRIWLNLSNDTEPINQMMLAYMTGATQGIDPTIDGRYINDSQTALNSLLNDEEFVIQGRSVPFDPTDVVPLTFKTTSTGNYTISIDHVDGLFSTNQDIILKDNVTGTETNLKVSPYTFTANAGVDNTRFSLKYQKTLGTATTILDVNNIVISKNNGIIKIKSGTKVLENVKIFDINGKLLVEKAKINATETSIESAKYAKQILIVQIKSEGKIINKKIVN